MPLKASALKHIAILVERYPVLAELRNAVHQASALICDCHRQDGKVLICGNGGSAADSEHIVGELMKGFVLSRPLAAAEAKRLCDAGLADWEEFARRLQRGIRAISLPGNISLNTAVANDTDPHMIFAQQTFVLGRPGDVLIGLSTSGNSRNVVNALKVGRAFGLKTIGLTGARPAAMDALCDVILKAPATETFKIQEYHLPLYHAICLAVEEEIFGEMEREV